MLVWPPGIEFFSDIRDDLQQSYQIFDSHVLTFEDDDFTRFVRSVYRVDDIAEWKVQKKLWGMRHNCKRVGVISYEVPDPLFRAKGADADVLISGVAEHLKLRYRARYRDKVEGYFHDLLLHIGDNYCHNRKIWRLLTDHVSKSGSSKKPLFPEALSQ